MRKMYRAQKRHENGRLRLLHMWTESKAQEDVVTRGDGHCEQKGAGATLSRTSPLGSRKKGRLRLAEKGE